MALCIAFGLLLSWNRLGGAAAVEPFVFAAFDLVSSAGSSNLLFTPVTALLGLSCVPLAPVPCGAVAGRCGFAAVPGGFG